MNFENEGVVFYCEKTIKSMGNGAGISIPKKYIGKRAKLFIIDKTGKRILIENKEVKNENKISGALEKSKQNVEAMLDIFS